MPYSFGALARSCNVIKEAVKDAKDRLKVKYNAARALLRKCRGYACCGGAAYIAPLAQQRSGAGCASPHHLKTKRLFLLNERPNPPRAHPTTDHEYRNRLWSQRWC